MYGPEKIPANTVLKSICEVITDELRKQDAFANVSMAYYGVELDYKITLKLHARKDSELEVEKSAEIGVKTDEEPEVVKIKGKRIAGKKVTVDDGKHTRPREGTAV